MSIGILISLAGPGPSHPFSLIYWGWPQECICLNTGLNAEWIASFFSRFFLLPVFLKFCNRLSSCVRACVCVRRSLPRSLSPHPCPPLTPHRSFKVCSRTRFLLRKTVPFITMNFINELLAPFQQP